LVEAMLAEGPSITLSGICAGLAFLAFVPTSYTGLAEFGIISALGMLVAVVVTFTVQPALMTLMPPRPQVGREVTIGIGGFIQRYYRLVLVLAVVATAFAAYEAKNVRIDTNPLNLQNPDTEAYRTYRDLAADPDTSPYFLDVTATDLDAAAKLAPRLAELAGVEGVRYLGDFIPENQEDKLAALAAARQRIGDSFFVDEPEPSPTDAELVEAFSAMREDAAAIGAVSEDNPIDPVIPHAGAELAAALERFAEQRGAEPAALQELGAALASDMPEIVDDLRTKFSVDEAVTVEDIPSALREEWITEDGRARLRVLPEEDIGTSRQMQVFAERVQTIAPEATGAPASVTGAGEAILRAFAEAIAYTVIAIGLVVAILRRRAADVLLILAPLAVAALWTVAASALLDLPFNFANIIVIPLLIGLGVASSIHIVARAHEVVRDGAGDHEEGMHVLDTSTPLAVLVAQLNTVAAFATLAVAEHRGLFSMGVLLGLAILFVLVVSLIVLPSFMFAIGMRKADAATEEAPAGPTV
jgi:hopanoid biosynthesis associated RND transporter like protein HpnN